MEVRLVQIGNSVGITIPQAMRKKYALKKGQKVVFEENSEGDLILRSSLKKGKMDTNFKKWWDKFIEENGQILDELEVR